jgi:hypothetical protein
MSYEISDDIEEWRCGAQRLLGTRLPEDASFVKSYFTHQIEFSGEEIGDQIDDSSAAICSAAGIDELDDQSYFHDIAETIRFCLARRYMGVCASNGCLDRSAVAEFIQDL